ncbi:MAG: cupin-like domain-containing protein [Cyanobacteria bacterium SZAS-4]|nr:cupin-like domain-containing protein [Cyanobacteria bacterium SZAS-4]
MAERVLDKGWVEWTRLNISRDCDTEGILEILLNQEFPVTAIREAMGDSFPENSQHLQGKEEAQVAKTRTPLQPTDKRDAILLIQRELAALNPKTRVIERRSYLGRAEFLEQYYAANRPVILCDLMSDWKALTKWTPEYLKSTCGDMIVEIQAKRETSPEFEIKNEPHRKEVAFNDFVDLVYKRGETNDFYLTARNGFFTRPGAKKLLDDIGGFPEYLNMDATGDWLFLWFGPKGTITPLHHDELNIFLAQVVGRKHVKLVPPNELDLIYNHYAVYSQVDCENPDYKRFPKFKDATVIDVDLNPGEVLFIPAGWWHHVRSLDPSISLSFTNFLFPNKFEWVHPDESGDESKTTNGGYGKPVHKSNSVVDHKALYTVPVKRLKKLYKNVEQVDTKLAQIFVIENFLTEEECDAMVAILNESNMKPSTVTNTNNGYRTSYSSDMSVDSFEIVKKIDLKLATALGVNLSHTEGVQVQKYEIGQEFKPHTDYFEPDTDEYDEHCTGRGNRTWTVMVYLRDTTKGGGTKFTKLGKTFYPKKGKALAWNNLNKDGTPNVNTMHWGMPVEEGQKIIITKWFRENGDGEMFLPEIGKK